MKRMLLPVLLLAAGVRLAAAESFKLEGHELILPGPIVFQTGTATLEEAASEVALKHIAAYLAEKKYVSTLRLEGHTERAGEPGANQKLSEQRALAVARWLVAHGTDCQRLLPVGFGDTKPVAANDSAENRARNRRIAVVNAALRGRAIGGLPADGGGQIAGDACTPAAK